MTEIETKLEVPAGFALPDFDQLTVAADERVELAARYWDTADLRLLGWGHTVRYRSASDGGEAGWTVQVDQASGSRSASKTRRLETDFAGDATMPPAGVRSLVAPFVGHRPLVPVADVRTRRHRVRLTDPDANTVEVSDDEVSSVVDGHAGPVMHEVEVELVAGDEELLDVVVDRLRRSGARKPGSIPKLARVLADDRTTPSPPLPPPPRRATETVAELVGAAISDGVRRLLTHDSGIRLGDDAEDVHQARVATRRLRSDLKTLAPLLEPGPVDGVRSELRWLGGLLGAVRDLDVLGVALHQEAVAVGADADACDALLGRLREERRQRVVELRDVLDSDRYVDLVERLVAMAQHPPFRAGVDGHARAAKTAAPLAAKSWRRVPKAAGRINRHAPDPDLHDLRRRAKRARYACELVAPVAGGANGKRLAKRLTDLQDVLGELQDAVVARKWLEATVRAGVSTDEAFVAGLVAARFEQIRIDRRASWRRQWKRAKDGGRQV